ncbi:SPFH domain-containing protein [Microbacterium sp.]|uniref:SPFH domain-containing protein n=1 Tax=Microbacterium sp. TaxID=51671 RepID=UPI003F6E4697
MFDMIASLFSGNALSVLVKTSGAALTMLVVVPALMKLFLVTVDEGSAAIRTRNGKPIIRKAKGGGDERGEVVVLRPGTHGAFPIFNWYRMVDVRARSTDLPARSLTGEGGHQHLVHASYDWRPIVSGHDLRVLELDVVNPKERSGNIVGAALRDLVHGLEGGTLPTNAELSDRIVAACAAQVQRDCGIELLSVMVTGDALTDGYLLSQAITSGGTTDTTPDDGDPTIPTVFAGRLTSVG